MIYSLYMTTYLDEDTIVKDVAEEEEELNEERLVGPKDEDDDDPSDTTPTEAEELADEGEAIIKKQREDQENTGDWD